MKTPIQELIETFEEMRSPIDSKVDVDFAISLMKSMLEKEKKLLIKAHGNKKVYDSQIDPSIVTGEEWYNKTFNTKER
jgi:hypothetical protein